MADLEIARTGLTETEARKAGLRVKSAMATGTDRPGICPNPHRITIKLVYEANTRQVLGAQAWGEKNVSARINAIAVAIRAGRACPARHLHVHQPDHPHPRRGGGGVYRCFPRINFETSSIFSIPKQSRRSPSARESSGFVL